ncbi:MAG: hypothetical protein H6622_15735 [Halobacteriovoraceae bacterium]|nr:hypothetical protein [Halobacteriovoraceae bacterium]
MKTFFLFLIFTNLFAHSSKTKYCQALMEVQSLSYESALEHFKNFSPSPLINEIHSLWFLDIYNKRHIEGKNKIFLALSPLSIIKNSQIINKIIEQYPENFTLYKNDNSIITHLNFDEFFKLWADSQISAGGVVSIHWTKKNVDLLIKEVILQLAIDHVRKHGINSNSRYPFLNFLKPEQSEYSALNGYSTIERYFRTLENFNLMAKKKYQQMMGQRDKRIHIFLYSLEELIERSFDENDRRLIQFKSVYKSFNDKNKFNIIRKRFGNSPEAMDRFNYYREKRWRELGGSPRLKIKSDFTSSEILNLIKQYYEKKGPYELREPLTWNDIENLGLKKSDIRANFSYLERLNTIVLPHYKIIPFQESLYKSNKPVSEYTLASEEHFLKRLDEVYKESEYKQFPMSIFFIISPFSSDNNPQNLIEFPNLEKINFLYGSFINLINRLNKAHSKIVFKKGLGASTWNDELVIQAIQLYMYMNNIHDFESVDLSIEFLRSKGSSLNLSQLKNIITKRLQLSHRPS